MVNMTRSITTVMMTKDRTMIGHIMYPPWMKNSIGDRPIKKAIGRESEVMLSSYDLGGELEVISKKLGVWRRGQLLRPIKQRLAI